MLPKENNYAFVDSQNLNLSIRRLGWRLDFARLRVYLKEKYGVTKAFLFVGYIETNGSLYENLRRDGYQLIFKPTFEHKDGNTKGNVDAELVLHTMIEYVNFDKAVIVTGDGDFHCLVEYLIQQNKLEHLLIPSQRHYSGLLRHFPSEYIAFVSHLRSTLTYKEKNSARTEP